QMTVCKILALYNHALDYPRITRIRHDDAVDATVPRERRPAARRSRAGMRRKRREHEPQASKVHVHAVRVSSPTGRFAAGAGRLSLNPRTSAKSADDHRACRARLLRAPLDAGAV